MSSSYFLIGTTRKEMNSMYFHFWMKRIHVSGRRKSFWQYAECC